MDSGCPSLKGEEPGELGTRLVRSLSFLPLPSPVAPLGAVVENEERSKWTQLCQQHHCRLEGDGQTGTWCHTQVLDGKGAEGQCRGWDSHWTWLTRAEKVYEERGEEDTEGFKNRAL